MTDNRDHEEVILYVGPDGRVESIHSDAAQASLSLLGDVSVRRASDVEYDAALGGWTVRFRGWVGLPDPAGTFLTRREALTAEVEALRQGRFGGYA